MRHIIAINTHNSCKSAKLASIFNGATSQLDYVPDEYVTASLVFSPHSFLHFDSK